MYDNELESSVLDPKERQLKQCMQINGILTIGICIIFIICIVVVIQKSQCVC